MGPPSLGFQPAVLLDPLLEQGGPDFEVGIGLGEADAVFAFLEDVEGNGDFALLAGFVKAEAVGDGDGLVSGGVEEESGRGGGVDLFFVG